MRLVCPNCDAEYEVDDAAIPREGRDVQCSNCNHAWFQVHPEVEAEAEAEADLYDPPPGAVVEERAPVENVQASAPPEDALPEAEDAALPDPDVIPKVNPEEDDSDEADGAGVGEEVPPAVDAPPASPMPQPRTLDETVLAVLREEAEREVAQRRADAARSQAPVMESQTEMPLAAPAEDQGGMAAAVQRIAKMRGMRGGEEPAGATLQVEEAPPVKPRGQMFPAIDEINSSLRATGDRELDDDDGIVGTLDDAPRKRGAFRRGFVLLVVLAVIVVALYVLAPLIGSRVPALAGAATIYVAAVDTARVWLDVNLRALVGLLQDLAGGQGG